MRIIILRFNPNDSLILAADKVAEKLRNTKAGITKLALHEFCNKILMENGIQTKSESGK